MAQFGCLIGSLLAVVPRILLVGAWLVADRWQSVWDGSPLIPLMGIAFLPYTTVMYLLVWTPAGIAGYAWMWLALGLLLDAVNTAILASAAGVGRQSASDATRWLRTATRRCIGVIRGTPLPVWLVFLLALMLRLVGTPYGLPQQLDPDEPFFVQGALRMISEGNLDPDWYGSPASTLMDGLAALYAAYGLAGIVMGTYDSLGDIVPAYNADGSFFLLAGRAYTAVAGTAVVMATYALARELRVSHFWSGLAALVVALSPLMIAYSWLVRMDMFQVTFMLLALLMMLRALRKPTLTAFVLAGIFVGLGVASKYPAVLMALPIGATAIVLAGQRRIRARAAIGYVVSAGSASLVAAAVVAPYLFTDFDEVLRHVQRENRSTHLGHTGEGFLTDLWNYLTVALPEALKGPGTVLGLVGLGSMLVARRGWLVPLAFAIYLLFISYLSLWWVRWALPLVPLAVAGAVFLFDRLELRLRPGLQFLLMYGLRIGVAALLLVPLIQPTAEMVWARATNDDAAVEAADWVEANIPAGSTLLIESYVPQVSAEDYELLIARNGDLIRWQEFSDQARPATLFGSLGAGSRDMTPEELVTEIEGRDVDYVLLSDSWIRRYRAEREDYADEWAVYETLLETYPTVMTFGNGAIVVLGIDPAEPIGESDADEGSAPGPGGSSLAS